MGSRSVLARNLRRLRDLRGLNQETLADEAGMDRSYLSDLERERYSASLDMLDALAAALRVPAYTLIMDDTQQLGRTGQGRI